MCSGVRWMPGSARLVRLEADQGIWLPRVLQPLLSHRRLPSCTVPVVFPLQSCFPTAGVPGLRIGPSSVSSSQRLLSQTRCSLDARGARCGSLSVFFGCPRGPKKFGAEAFKSAGFFGVPSDLARDPPGPGSCWRLSGVPLQFGAGPLRDLAFVKGTPPLWCGALRGLAFVKGTLPLWRGARFGMVFVKIILLKIMIRPMSRKHALVQSTPSSNAENLLHGARLDAAKLLKGSKGASGSTVSQTGDK